MPKPKKRANTSKPSPKHAINPVFNEKHRDDIARLLTTLAGAAIVGFVYYITGRAALSDTELTGLIFAILLMFVSLYRIRKD
ncbi:MAG: hypothetical protein QM537_08105 [Candidatus Symbiobacter sp.]|nr:hypothetical protein [Candidatus Symbiobacter sp.]